MCCTNLTAPMTLQLYGTTAARLGRALQARAAWLFRAVLAAFCWLKAAGRRTHHVRARSLHSICKDLALQRIDLLKVDTEGHEVEVRARDFGAAALHACGEHEHFACKAPVLREGANTMSRCS